MGQSSPVEWGQAVDLSQAALQLLDLDAATVSARRCAESRDVAGAYASGRAVPRLLLAEILHQEARPAEASRGLEELQPLLAGAVEETGWVRVRVDQVLIKELAGGGRAAEALVLSREALPRAELLLGKEHRELTGMLGAVAHAHRAAGDVRAALATYHRFRAAARLSPSRATVPLERSALLLGTAGEKAGLEEAGEALAALEAGGAATGARLAARRRWAEAQWRIPAHRAEVRRVLESALPTADAVGNAATEAWLASHRL